MSSRIACPGQTGQGRRFRNSGVKMVAKTTLVAHDNKKQDLLDWAAFNREPVGQHALYATGNPEHLLTDRAGPPTGRPRPWSDS